MGVVLPRLKMDIVESVRRCVDNPSVSCCSRNFFGIIILLWHLVYANDWLTTKELCKKAKFRRCNRARVYLYKLKKKGVVITSKIHTGETIWRVNERALKGVYPSELLELLTQHYKICKEYYKTGSLKKPVEESTM
jgi:hypothetical protein